MRFSEYLRTLDEGNYGHEFGEEAEKHEAALAANRELAKVKRDEASIGSSEEHEAPEETPEEKEKAKKKEKAKNKKKKEKEEEDEVQLDWQIPSLRESERPGEAINYGRDEEDESPKPVNTERWDGHGNPPEGYEDAGGKIGSDGTVKLRKKSVKKESVETPERDALGRISIHSINEASKARLKRKLKSGNTTYTQKQAAMKQLKLKQADQQKRAKKRASTEEDLSIAVRAGDAVGEKSVVLPGGDKPLKRSKLRPGSADLQRHEDREADEGASREQEKRNTGRNRHLDEPK